MLPTWLRQLKKKRFQGYGVTSPISAKLNFEAMEDRIAPDVKVWSGGTIALNNGQVVVVAGNTTRATTLWSDPGNWANGVPQPGDDVVFPAGLSANAVPPSRIVNNIFVFDTNSSIDRDFQIRNLTILDDNYRIDAFSGDSFGNGAFPNVPADQIVQPGQGATPTLTITGEIRSSIAVPVSQLLGMSLIGALNSNASALNIVATGTTQSLRADDVGILKIGVPIDEPDDGGPFDTVPGPGVQQVGFNKTGPGTMVLSGASSFRGQVTVNTGSLYALHSAALGNSLNGAEVTSPTATLGVAQNGQLDTGVYLDSLVIRGTGDPLAVVNTPASPGSLAGVQDPFTVFSAGQRGDTGTATINGNVNLAGDGAIGAFGSSIIINGQVTGAGSLTKSGPGRLTLTNKNAYSGQTLINVGTVEIQNNDALSSSPLSSTTVASGATLAIRGSLTVPEPLILNGDGQGTDGNGNPFGALRLLSPQGLPGDSDVSRGPQATWTGPITFATSSSVGVAASNNVGLISTSVLTLAGPLTSGPTADLSKVDQGTVRIPNANPALRGNTNVRNGVLQIADGLALGPANAGQVVLTPTGTGNVQGTLQADGTFTIGKTLVLNGQGNVTDGALRVRENPIGTPSNVTWAGPITLGSATSVRVDPVSTLSFTGSVAGPAANSNLDKLGTGTFVLGATNTYLGATVIREGTAVLTNGRGLGGTGGAGTVVAAGASLVLPNPLNVTGEQLTLSGTGVGGLGALQVPAGMTNFTGPVVLNGVNTTEGDISVATGGVLNFSGVLSGDADLRKLGQGELRLTGNQPNQFVKTTFLDAGTLALGKAVGQALGGPTGGAIIIGDGAGGNNVDVLRLDVPGQIPDVSSIIIRESGLFDLNNVNERLGGVTAVSLRGGDIRTGTGTLFLGGNFTTAGSAEQSVIDGNINVGGVTRSFGFIATPRVTLSTGQVSAPTGVPVRFTFTSQANPTLSIPTGTVVFTDTFTAPDGTTTTRILGTTPTNPTGRVNIDLTGTAILDVTDLVAGTHQIAVQYSGDTAYPPVRVVLAQDQQIFNPSQQTLLSVNANPALPNQPLTFAFRVIGPAQTVSPTGTVRLFAQAANGPRVDVTPGGTAVTVDASGQAQFVLPLGLATGVYTIQAEYSGDATYAPTVTTLAPTLSVGAIPVVSVSSVVVPNAGQTPTTTADLPTAAAPVLRGDVVRLNFRAAGSAGNPSGSVTFIDTYTDFNGVAQSKVLGTAVLGANGAPPGTAFLDTAGPNGGPFAATAHTIIAEYSGDPVYAPSTGILDRLVVTNPIAASISANTNPVLQGTPVTYTLRLTGRPGQTFGQGAGMPGDQPTPTGRVLFFATDPTTGVRSPIGPGILTAATQYDGTVAAQAQVTQIPTVVTPAGTRALIIDADFQTGDDNYASQTSVATLNPAEQTLPVVTQTNLLFVSTNNPARPFEPFTLRVSSTRAQGTITLRQNGVVIAVDPFFNTNPLTGAFIQSPSIFNIAGLPPVNGTITYTIDYVAVANNPVPSVNGFPLASGQQVIAPISGTLFASANPIRENTPLTLTYLAVTAPNGTSGGNATAPNPTGVVTFRANGNPLGTAALETVNDNDGRPITRAILTLPNGLGAGPTTVTATYGGNAFYRPQNPVTLDPNLQVLGSNQVLIALTSSANSSRVGDNVTFTLTASGNANQPPATGTVTFRATINGADTLLGPPQVLAGGVATLSIATLPVGVFRVRAIYSGDSNYAATTAILSPPQRIVNLPLAQVTANTPLDPVTGAPTQAANTPVTFTLNLRNSPRPLTPVILPTGDVQFFAAPIVGGVVGTPVLINTATVTAVPVTVGTPVDVRASVTAAGFAPGSYRVTARYTAFNTLTGVDQNYEPIEVVLAPNLVIVPTAAQVPTASPPPTVLPIQQPQALFNGAISGTPPAPGAAPPGIIKAGVGSLTVNGRSVYTGPTIQNSAVGSSVVLAGDEVLPNTPLVVAAGTVEINGRTQTVASLGDDTGAGGTSTAGTLSFTGGGTLTVNSAANTTYAGAITGTGTLVKSGTGSLTLGTAAGPTSTAFGGNLSATGGTLLVNTNFSNADLTATGATVGGTGTVDDLTVNAGATVTIGVTPVGNAAPTAGTFTADNSTTFNGGAVAIDLIRAGATGTVTGDRLITAAVLMGTANPILRLSAAAYNNPTLGDNAVTILTSTAALPAGFRFRRPDGSVLRENATIADSGRAFRINYTANAVTLTYAGLDVAGTLMPSANPSTPGDTVTYTLTLPAGVGGSVTFTVSGPGAATPVSQTVTVPASGVVSAPITFPSVGSYDVVAAYSGNATIAQKDFNLTQVVNIPTAMSLTTSNPSAAAGEAVTFTATVTSAGGVPTGTVTFTNLTTGAVLGTAPLVNGTASLTTAALPTGSSTVRASYATDGTFRSNVADVVQTVSPPPGSGPAGAFYTNAILLPAPDGTQTLVVQGSGVPGGIGVFPGFPRSTVLLFTDINGDGNKDLILILPDVAVVLDGATGRFLFVFGDLDGNGQKELLTYNADGSFTVS
jgi:autotransporter-associated beta strand protein